MKLRTLDFCILLNIQRYLVCIFLKFTNIWSITFLYNASKYTDIDKSCQEKLILCFTICCALFGNFSLTVHMYHAFASLLNSWAMFWVYTILLSSIFTSIHMYHAFASLTHKQVFCVYTILLSSIFTSIQWRCFLYIDIDIYTNKERGRSGHVK